MELDHPRNYTVLYMEGQNMVLMEDETFEQVGGSHCLPTLPRTSLTRVLALLQTELPVASLGDDEAYVKVSSTQHCTAQHIAAMNPLLTTLSCFHLASW